MSDTLTSALRRARPGRRLHGISAVLLPFTPDGAIDWRSLEQLLANTRAAGLDVAVNMDTGFGDLLTPPQREQVLDCTRAVVGTTFYAGAYPDQSAADPVASYHASIAAILAREAIPVIVQWRGMHALAAAEKAALYRRICALAERAVGFELGPMFAPHGEIWDDATFERIVEIPQLIGAKHSSLDRATELGRLAARDRLRPDFRVYTGNDLAIDMVLYGSDYLLGLSAFAPEEFAGRDRALADDDTSFLSRNDALQHLGNVGFRAPVPAYKHSAAMFLHLTGKLGSDSIHPRAARRPQSDRILLFDCAVRLGLVGDVERTLAERVEPFLS
ncbi:MAG TPA: DUF993 family protein [Terriglobales bacterium]|nr:DUF993 family protein [Terriglobales bacterium]